MHVMHLVLFILGFCRKNKNGIEGDVGSPQDPNLRTTSFLVSENMMRSEINSTWRERRNTTTCWQR